MADRTLEVRWLGRVDYASALSLQEELLELRLDESLSDQLLVLEHDPVYTLGRGADENDLLGAPERLGVPVFRVGRGGGVTYHGPGQLVSYPIVALAHAGRDVKRYVRMLEETLIRTCGELGAEATAPEGLTGIWVGNEKLASIGIGVRRWVAHHGIALNVTTDLDYFAHIVACRMPALRVTSLSRLLGRPVSLDEVREIFVASFSRVFGYASEDSMAHLPEASAVEIGSGRAGR